MKIFGMVALRMRCSENHQFIFKKLVDLQNTNFKKCCKVSDESKIYFKGSANNCAS